MWYHKSGIFIRMINKNVRREYVLIGNKCMWITSQLISCQHNSNFLINYIQRILHVTIIDIITEFPIFYSNFRYALIAWNQETSFSSDTTNNRTSESALGYCTSKNLCANKFFSRISSVVKHKISLDYIIH